MAITPISSVTEYIASFPDETQTRLNAIRNLVSSLCSEATESISYGMPAYKLGGKPLIYFAAFKQHIGLYATPSGHAQFKNELAHYKQGKGSVQFPLSEPLPIELIEQIIRFRLHETALKQLK
jgi:uncharacterized protein YdhG (YjbR/CyaY superfamily)